MSRICKYFASGYCAHGDMCRYKHSSSHRNHYEYEQPYQYDENNYQDYEYDYAPSYSYHARDEKHNYRNRRQKEFSESSYDKKSLFDVLIENIKESASHYEHLKWDLTAMDLGANLPIGLVELSPDEVRHYSYAIKALGQRLKPFNKLIKKTVGEQQTIYRHLTKMEPATLNTLRELYKHMNDSDDESKPDDSENLLAEIAQMVNPFPRYRKPSSSTPMEDVMDVSRVQPEQQPKTAAPKPSEISFSFARVNASKPHLASTPKLAPPDRLASPVPPIMPHSMAAPINTSETMVQAVCANEPSIPDQLYTPLNALTDEEKQAFLAAAFVVGRVPTRPPPLELCHPHRT